MYVLRNTIHILCSISSDYICLVAELDSADIQLFIITDHSIGQYKSILFSKNYIFIAVAD